MKRTLLIGFILSLASLLAGGVATLLAAFGVPVWIFVLLLGWLLTIGLPSLCAVLLLARFWEGLPFAGFLVSVGFLAMVFQSASVWLIRWGIRRIPVGRVT